MRLLLAGDLHLGRRSTRIPDTVPHAATADVWHRLVDAAIAHTVDAVVLSGDVIDQDNRFFEARTPLEAGLRRLRDAGIRTIAVAGNHDHEVLPAVVRSLPDGLLTLLGAGGRWERVTIAARDGASRLHVLGWSFPSRIVRDSPLDTVPAPIGDGVPTLGVVHGDLDAPASPYAPLAHDRLVRAGVDAWLLGHLHLGGPRQRDGEPLVLYPGSPQPLDPGESGAHGAWLARLRPGEPVHLQHLPLASVRYDTVVVAITADDTLDAVRQRTVDAVESAALGFLDANDALQHIAVRVQWRGTSVSSHALDALQAPLREWTNELAVTTSIRPAPVTLGITHVHDATTRARDVARLAEGHDAIAWLARLRLALDATDGAHEVDTQAGTRPESRLAMPDAPVALHDARRDDRSSAFARVRAEARRIVEESARHAAYRDVLDIEDREPARVDALLREQVDALLDALLAQRATERP